MKISKDLKEAKKIVMTSLKKSHEIIPIFLLFDKKNTKPVMLMTPWSNDEIKTKIIQDVMPVAVAYYKTKKFIFITESFITSFDQANPNDPGIKEDAIVIVQIDPKYSNMINLIVEKDKKDKWKVVKEFSSRTKTSDAGVIPNILTQANKLSLFLTEEEIKTKYEKLTPFLQKYETK